MIACNLPAWERTTNSPVLCKGSRGLLGANWLSIAVAKPTWTKSWRCCLPRLPGLWGRSEAASVYATTLILFNFKELEKIFLRSHISLALKKKPHLDSTFQYSSIVLLRQDQSFTCMRQLPCHNSRLSAMLISWPSKPEISTVWFLPENVCHSQSQVQIGIQRKLFSLF